MITLETGEAESCGIGRASRLGAWKLGSRSVRRSRLAEWPEILGLQRSHLYKIVISKPNYRELIDGSDFITSSTSLLDRFCSSFSDIQSNCPY